MNPFSLFPQNPYETQGTIGSGPSLRLGGNPFGTEETVSAAPVLCHRSVVLGLDLGQANDPAAAIQLERQAAGSEFIGAPDPYVRCRYLRQWKGESYWQIAEDVLEQNPDVMVVDYGGVGRAVVDMLRQMASQRSYRGAIIPLATVGSQVTNERMHEDERGRYVTVPKVSLLTPIQLLSQGPEKLVERPDGTKAVQRHSFLAFPPSSGAEGEPLVELLRKQLHAFQMKHSSRGTPQFGNDPLLEDHDDLVIALGLACWYMMRFSGREPSILC